LVEYSVEQTFASMFSTGKEDIGEPSKDRTSRDTRSSPSMSQLTEQFNVAQSKFKQANKAKREAATTQQMSPMPLQEEPTPLREPLEAAAEPVGLAKQDVSDDVISKHDVSDDVKSKPRKPEWKDEALQTIPNFSCVVDRLMTVEQWCACANRLMQEYGGNENMKIRALRDAVPIAELKARDVDLTQYTVESFLARISSIWNDLVGSGRVKAVMVRPQGRSWTEFRHDLLTWAAVRGVPAGDDWILAQMRANIEMHRDVLINVKVSSDSWARVMDRTEGQYNHARQDVQSSSSVAAVQTEESIDSIQPKARHKFTKDGRPICDFCHKVGHLKRQCHKRNKKRQNRK